MKMSKSRDLASIVDHTEQQGRSIFSNARLDGLSQICQIIHANVPDFALK